MVTYLKQGDTLPIPTATLIDSMTGQPVNLTGCAVFFHLGNFTNEDLIDSPASIVDAINGKVSYSWLPTDTNIAGAFVSEWKVVFADSSIITFPVSTYDSVIISADLSRGLVTPV